VHVTRCRSGVHGCRVADLPWWLQEELRIAEYALPDAQDARKDVASRARLDERVGAWDDATARAFAEACARRARDRAADALERAGAPAPAGELRACETPREIRDVTRALDVPEAARVSVLMAGDGARRAITGPTATAAYIAAHAAGHGAGASAMEAERRWQSAWLLLHLGLSR
jgi:hypothetical protein